MATQGNKPVGGSQAADSLGRDEQWDNIELPDPDNEWEEVYKIAADPHSIDYYDDDGLIEKPIEDDWTNLTQIPKELQKSQEGEKSVSAQTPAGPANRIRKRLARQRNVMQNSQQTAAVASSKDGAAATSVRMRASSGAGTGDIADERIPDTTTATTTSSGIPLADTTRYQVMRLTETPAFLGYWHLGF